MHFFSLFRLVLVTGLSLASTLAISATSFAAPKKSTLPLLPSYHSETNIPSTTWRGIPRSARLLCLSARPRNKLITATAAEFRAGRVKDLPQLSSTVRLNLKSALRNLKLGPSPKKKKSLNNSISWLRLLNAAITQCGATQFPIATPPSPTATPQSTNLPNGENTPNFIDPPTPTPTPTPTATIPQPTPSPGPTSAATPTPTQTSTPRPTNTPGAPLPTLAGNCVRLTEVSGRSGTNIPVQLGRPFIRGEISHYPIAIVDGSSVVTQADVKTRWPDGTVAHAILTFYISLTVNQQRVVCFGDQTTGMNDQVLTQAQMLAPAYNFEAVTALTSPTTNQTVSASARSALNGGKFTYWLQGRNATSILIGDHSTTRSLDLGFDNFRSFRPTWEATFFPLSNHVRVRINGEASNSEAIQDMTYNLAATVGLNAPRLVMHRINLKHHAMGTWSREFWVGTSPPPEFSIDHNIRYLGQTGFVPNYDPTVTVTQAAINSAYGSWYGSARDLTQAGKWTIRMPDAGGHLEIGPVPSWVAYWLYTGDIRMAEYSIRQAELAGNWPMNIREGDASKFFDPAQTIPGLGLPISPINRTSLMLYDDNSHITSSPAQGTDALDIVGARTNDGWVVDGAHQPDPFSAVYTLTGEYWFFERLHHWAMWGRFHKHGSNVSNGRGPYGWSINDQTRADAWLFRARTLAAFLCPDSHVAKADLDRSVREGIAIWEGMRNITGTSFHNTASWVWGNTVARTGAGSSNGSDTGIYGLNGVPHTNPPRYQQAQALHYWKNGVGDFISEHVNNTTVSIELPWHVNYLIHSLARAEEMGYPTTALKNWIGQFTAGQLLDPGYTPTLAAQYYTPATTNLTSPFSFYQTWNQVRNGYLQTRLNSASGEFYASIGDTNHGYSLIMRAAVQSFTNISNGPQAQAVMDALFSGQTINFAANPKWAVKRR